MVRCTQALDYKAHIFRSPKFRSVVHDAIKFFADTPVDGLPPEFAFPGCGVYAIYYLGAFELYQQIAQLNRQACSYPIYIGKAVPPGWRAARVKVTESQSLFQRLREHSRSIEQAKNIDLAHFKCRFMILGGVESDLIVPVESELIRRYCPLWNSIVDGFGNHDPGSGRYKQACSDWDILHPGRAWVKRLTGKTPKLVAITKKIDKEIQAFLATLSARQ